MKQELLEKEILSSLIHGGEKVAKALQIVSIDDFVVYRRQAEVIFDCWKNDKNIVMELVSKKLSLSSIQDDTFSTRSIEKACAELKKISTRGALTKILGEAHKSVPENDIETFIGEVQQRLIKVIETGERENSDIESAVGEFIEYQNVYEEKRKTGGKLLGLSTGYEKLDDVIDGLRPEHLWVIGGYTNLGKTYASLNILSHLLKQGKRTVFYSLEMSRVDIISRVLGILLNENGSGIAKGFGDKSKVTGALEVIKKSRLGIHSTKTDISQILLSMYEESIKDKPELFVVDFLQLVTVKGTKTEYEATTQAILELQKAAKRFKLPIIVLSQVSNDGARAGDQQVMGFKGSGAIAAAADLAIELVSGEDSIKDLREKMNRGEPVLIKWHIKKNRHGRVGSMTMEFTGKTGVFTEFKEQEL
jgi:replicative DNA helicase